MIFMPRDQGNYKAVLKDERCRDVFSWYARTVFIEAQEDRTLGDLKMLMGDKAIDEVTYKCTRLLEVILRKRELEEEVLAKGGVQWKYHVALGNTIVCNQDDDWRPP
jgi:hypothetical protein